MKTWFRLYAEFATDPKVQMLSEIDQRRYVMLLCLRCGEKILTDDQVAFQLRIPDYQDTKKRLLEQGLIDEKNRPIAWEKRQFIDASEHSSSYVYFALLPVAKRDYYGMKISSSKNPWSRLKDLQAEHGKTVKIIASFRANRVLADELNDILRPYQLDDNWLKAPKSFVDAIVALSKKRKTTDDELRQLCVDYQRSNSDVATSITNPITTITDTDTDISLTTVRDRRFSKPSIDELENYFRERGCIDASQPQKFFLHYESNGWKVGKNPMKDWKAAVRHWLLRSQDYAKNQSKHDPGGRKLTPLERVREQSRDIITDALERQNRNAGSGSVGPYDGDL